MSVKREKIQELVAKAEESLRRENCFESERMFLKAMAMARQEQTFDLLAHVASQIMEARRQRMQLAIQAGRTITIVDQPFTEDFRVRPGCYLIQPPLVGLDARRLRLIAMGNDVPIIVGCREPLTKTKQVPIVAISPSSTLRARVAPPAKSPTPEKSWLLNALQELGDTALAAMDATLPLIRRIDLLLDYLDALPEHENLHLALEAAAREAHDTGLRDSGPSPADKAATKARLRG